MLTGEPFVPSVITVHLGVPDADAPNVTVSFPDYVKNVASSEIFPTWEENALRANLYAITSFALNRIYTEWYRSRGYDFDITSETQYDQKFIEGRQIYDNIAVLADEQFDDYVRRQGKIEPLFTAFCNGTTSLCDGLSQWGTVDLAGRGYLPLAILQYYYGEDIEIVRNAPVRSNTMSYPGSILTAGSTGTGVQTVQIQLNRISRNYPAMPKIPLANGTYDSATEDTVRRFQEIFDLPVTGAVDKATWYRIAYIYTSVKRLAELDSEGVTLEELPMQFEENLTPSVVNEQVRGLQYFLAVIGAYYESVEPLQITGEYDAQTEASVRSFQRVYGLPVTGIVDEATWEDIYRAYAGIAVSIPVEDAEWIPLLYPGYILQEGMTDPYVKALQEYLTYIHGSVASIPEVRDTGYFGPVTRAAVTAFQRYAGLTPNGAVGAVTWDEIAGLYSDLRFGYEKRPYQAPGYVIK